MLLVVDIGNTNTVIGCFDGEDLRFDLRIGSDRWRTSDEYRAILVTLLRQELGDCPQFTRAVVSSVVPPLTSVFVEVLARSFSLVPLVIGAGINLGIEVRTDDPSTVGADRIVNALAAREGYGAPALVVDFGTATTFDYLSADGAYEGGVIAPGVGVAVDALVSRTSMLPRIELTWPRTVVGRSTVSAMQSGTVIGYLCLVDGLIDKIVEEVGEIPHIIATGGFGKLCADHSRRVQTYDRHLTLKGMKLVAERN
jgi:type III pantothenate kinase